jgi:hypothetical protein
VLSRMHSRKSTTVKPSAVEHERSADRELFPYPDAVTEWDHATFLSLISTELSGAQRDRLVQPAEVFPRQEHVLAVHWHPEFVPMELIRQRIDATFPNRSDALIIPTQHNILLEYDRYAGVEVDCFSRGFNRKVQLLVHFDRSRVEGATVFRSMLAHTFNYRSRQLFEFIDTIVDRSYEDRVSAAAREAGADSDLVTFVRVHARKMQQLLHEYQSVTPPEAIRNKLLANYLTALRDIYDERLIVRSLALLGAIKRVVKAHFNNEFFYATEEVIEEVRRLGGGIVIPHPEQFWPILLADYDVDGYEVWNPQSQEYTDFLVTVVNRQNRTRSHGQRSILIFMGDDCHMGEKAKDPAYQDPEKVRREIGVQPAWDDPAIRKSLIIANADRHSVIREYRARLVG